MQNQPKSKPVTIAVMGATGVGKSTFVNLVSRSRMQTSDGLESCTQEVCVGDPFVLDGRTVTLIDTPGFDDTHRSEADILRLISDFLTVTYREGRKLSGIIFLHRISETRMGGMMQRNLRHFRNLCGEHTLKNIVVVTTMWDLTPRDLAEKRELELRQKPEYFKSALDKGARMLRHDNTVDSAHRILRTIIGFPPAVLRIQQEIVDEGKKLEETDVGRGLALELARLEARFLAEAERMRKNYEDSLAKHDAAHIEEVRTLKDQLSEAKAGQEKAAQEKTALVSAHDSKRHANQGWAKEMWDDAVRREVQLQGVRKENTDLKSRQAELEAELKARPPRVVEEPAKPSTTAEAGRELPKRKSTEKPVAVEPTSKPQAQAGDTPKGGSCRIF